MAFRRYDAISNFVNKPICLSSLFFPCMINGEGNSIHLEILERHHHYVLMSK